MTNAEPRRRRKLDLPHTCRVLAFVPIACVALLKAQPASITEARTQVDQFWAKKVSICGDVLATRFVAGDWTVMKNGGWSVEPHALSQSDTMNGIQWRGRSQLQAATSRNWQPGRGWQPWVQGTGFGAFDVAVVKTGGRWTFTPNGYGALDQMVAPKCTDIPREPTASEKAAALDAKIRALCNSAMQKSMLGVTEAFVKAAIDVNSCRDGEGRTLLMMNLQKSPFGWTGDSLLLIRSGADLNVKDKKGWSALRYAIASFKDFQQRGLREVVQSYITVMREMIARGVDREDLVDNEGNIR